MSALMNEPNIESMISVENIPGKKFDKHQLALKFNLLAEKPAY